MRTGKSTPITNPCYIPLLCVAGTCKSHCKVRDSSDRESSPSWTAVSFDYWRMFPRDAHSAAACRPSHHASNAPCVQVVTEIGIAFLDESTPAQREWFVWRDLTQVLDIACCAVIIFPIVWRIKHLREAAETDGKAERCAAARAPGTFPQHSRPTSWALTCDAVVMFYISCCTGSDGCSAACRSIQQLVMFKHFYIMVLAYIYFTRIVVFILFATLPPEYVWVSSFAKELAALVFYSLTAMQFRPHGGTGYFQLISTEELELSSL